MINDLYGSGMPEIQLNLDPELKLEINLSLPGD